MAYARAEILRLGLTYLILRRCCCCCCSRVEQTAGGSFATSNGVFEVAPSLSYDGEGLHELVAAQCPEGGFSLPCELRES